MAVARWQAGCCPRGGSSNSIPSLSAHAPSSPTGMTYVEDAGADTFAASAPPLMTYKKMTLKAKEGVSNYIALFFEVGRPAAGRFSPVSEALKLIAFTELCSHAAESCTSARALIMRNSG